MKTADRLENVRMSLSRVARHLNSVEERRERLLKGSRDVISACSKAIMKVHTGDGAAAKSFIAEAREGLESLRKASSGDLKRYLIAAETEYVEAETLLSLAEGRALPGMKEMRVQPSAYVLGLLDAIGESKRRLLDSVRAGDVEEAERLFELMEELYVTMAPLAVHDNVVPGLKRKLDVDRGLLEDMRGLLTEETRRTKLLKSMRSLEEKMNVFEKEGSL